jgi:hypothetical protein
MVNGFTKHLYTRLGSTSNYSATADLHNSQITTAPAKPFSSLLCLHEPFPSNGFNSGDSSASHAQLLSSQSSVQNSTELTTGVVYHQSVRLGAKSLETYA